MTVQRVGLLDDSGSIVLAEIVRQLNRAYNTVVVPVQAQTGSVNDGSTSFDISAGAASVGCMVFYADEDVFITGIDVVFTAAVDAATGIVIDTLLVAENTNAAPDPGTNTLVFASDGTGPLIAAGTRTDLAALTATDAGTGLDANSFTNTTGAHAAITATDFGGTVRLDAGQKLRLLLTEIGAAAEGCTLYISYRPVKDELALEGGYVGADANKRFSTRDR